MIITGEGLEDKDLVISTAAEVKEGLREVYPKVSFGYFIQKPITIDKLVKRLLVETD